LQKLENILRLEKKKQIKEEFTQMTVGISKIEK